MELQPPALILGQQAAEELLSLDEQFTHVLIRLMQDEIAACTAVGALLDDSAGTSQQYKQEASETTYNAARSLHKRELAEQLDVQAASWQLLQTLYCSSETPAGACSAVAPDAAACLTWRQQCSELVNSDPMLRRCAQVVAWLESLAAQRLAHTTANRFAHYEGIWRETILTAGAGGSILSKSPGPAAASAAANANVLELDPDAPTRGRVKLAASDRQGEERLAGQLWHLIRAGEVHDGRQLCCQAGQAWRSLSMAGGGGWGPLPVGQAAAEAAMQLDEQAAAEELAWQTEGGTAARHLNWKWACYAAAEAAANATPGNRWEAAVYAALCGHVVRMLPVCQSWEDEAWAYCRGWLELQTDSQLLNDLAGSQPEAQEELLGVAADNMVSTELLAGIVGLAAASAYSSSADSGMLTEGLAAMTGAWPLQRLLWEAEATRTPKNFTELMQLLNNSSNSTVRAASQHQQRMLQLHLMAEAWADHTTQLALDAEVAAQQIQQLEQQGLLGAAGLQDGDVTMENGITDVITVADAASDKSAGSVMGVLRFAAHWALMLRALGLIPDEAWLQGAAEEDQKELAREQVLLSKVVYHYALQLAQQPATLLLVPPYLCHLRQSQRQQLLEVLLANATDFGDDSTCQELYLQLVAAAEHWAERQQRLDELVLVQGRQPGPWWDADIDGEQGLGDATGDDAEMELDRPRPPSNCLFGDLRDQEVRLLMQHLVSNGLGNTSTSPLHRCRQLRWLFYSFTGALEQQQQQQQQDTLAAVATAADNLVWQDMWVDAMHYTLALASEMAVNPDCGSGGLQVLMTQVVPASFLADVAAVAARQLKGYEQVLQVSRQLQALGYWQQYVDLDARYQQWREDYGAALAAAEGTMGNDTAAADAASAEQLGQLAPQGEALVSAMLGLAKQDALRLPASADLVQMLDEQIAIDATEPTRNITEGESLAAPLFDSANEVPTELALYVTVARGAAGDQRQEDAVESEAVSDPDLPFIPLQAWEAKELEQQVAAFLQHVTHGTHDVTVSSSSPVDATEGVAGTVLVTLTAWTTQLPDNAPDAEVQRTQRRMQRAWKDMVAVAAQLLSNNSAGASSSSNDGGGVGNAGLPRLALVHCNASLSTRLVLCRHRATSKLLRRSGKVLLELARAGHPSSQLDILIDAAGDAAGRDGPQLLELLMPSDAARLLVCLEQIIEQQGGLDG